MNQSPQILIIDDNPQNLRMLGNVLKENGYNPLFAKSGIQALNFLLERKLPALILLDISMPKMDGFEVCKRLKQNAATQHIPAIFMTAYTEKEKVIEGFQLGAVDYVTKPFHAEELLTRVQTHIKLKATEKQLKQAVITKNKFVSIIAHDLNNLFDGLMGLSDLLKIARDQQDEKEIDYLIHVLQKTTNQGHKLLQNLLEWSRVQSGRIKPQLESLDLESLVKQNMALFTAHQKNVSLFSSLAQTQVFADKNMLTTILRNLLSNALKFTPEGGEIKIYSQKKDNEVEISIFDTGVGIKAEDIEKLFKIDVSYSTKGTANEQGNGFGLILCKELVEKMDGTIGVESEEGKGSLFWLRLPLKQFSSSCTNYKDYI